MRTLGDAPPAADWGRMEAMTDADRDAAALADPDAQPLTEAQLGAMRRVSRVKALRHTKSQ